MQKKGKVALISMQPHWKEIDNENFTRIPEELEKLGYQSEILFFDKFFIGLKNKKTNFFYDEKSFKVDDYKLYILILAGAKNNHFLIEALEYAGAKTKNSLSSIKNASDKMKTLLILNKHGIPTMPAAMNFSQYFMGPLLSHFEDEQYICKLTNGSLGKGVGLLESKISLISMVELMASLDIPPSKFMFEKFAVESAGRDVRIIATKDKVIASMERKSPGIDFRANIYSGGNGSRKKATAEMKAIAIKSVKLLGLEYGGVDILETKNGPVVIEVNANPGLKIESCIGSNVTKDIVKHLVKGI